MGVTVSPCAHAGIDRSLFARGQLETFERADRRQEALVGILGIEPRFDRMAA